MLIPMRVSEMTAVTCAKVWVTVEKMIDNYCLTIKLAKVFRMLLKGRTVPRENGLMK